MRKQHLTNAINTILETNEEVTIRVKDNSYLFLERAGQLVFDALHKEGYKICTYDGQVQVLEELGADLPKKGLEEIIEPCVFDVDVKKIKLINSIKNELKYIYPECYLTEELESFSKHQLKYLWQILSSSGFNDNEKKTIVDTSFEKFKSELYKAKKYTIKDLKKGKVGIEYKGDLDKLTKVLRVAFPKDDHYITNEWTFYFKDKYDNDIWHISNYKPDHIKVWVSENDIEL